MLHFPKWKIFLILSICFLGILLIIPNYKYINNKFNLPDWYPVKKLNLGLDLRGGAHLLLEVNIEAYLEDQLENLQYDIKKILREKRIGYTNFNINKYGLNFDLLAKNQEDSIKDIIFKYSKDLIINNSDNHVSILYRDQYLNQLKENVINQSIEIVNRRIDETGTKEPTIHRQGKNRILVQVPGLYDPENLKRILGKTAKLSFHEVNQSIYDNNDSMQYIPAGFKKLPLIDRAYGRAINIVINKIPVITGDMLVDARASFDNNGGAAVSFKFNSVGTRKFGEYTKTNVSQPFAIVLDDKILSAPVIKEPITGGAGIISGNFTVKEANDLALLLRAGALPAPLIIVEERTVGPSLGEDAINAGKMATLIGICLVALFMFLSYGRFGFYANIALIMNVIMIISILSLLGATLTLPGIAGIALTIGMAVDANVLIFERIKEELKKGSSVIVSIDQGFKSAFKAIFDSNLTTLIAALILYILGSGPVRGFAVTLSIGILISMFTAIMLTRLMIANWVKRKKPKNLVINGIF